MSTPLPIRAPSRTSTTAAPVLALALATTLVLGACSADAVRVGMSRDEVIASKGQPGRVVPFASGTRLQYSLQPSGQRAFMIDLDANYRVVRSRQVLVAQEFAHIEIGTWTRADVEREFGPPASVDHVASWPFDIMTYRWREITDMFFWVYLDQNQVVRRTEQGIEYPRDR